jgi:hypothetical protein
MRRLVLLSFLTVLVHGPGARAQDSTSELIRAPRIDNLIIVRRSSDAAREQTKAEFEFSLNPEHSESLQSGMTMASSGEIRVAFFDFNPLAIAVAGSETASPDPNYQQLSEFVDALLKLPGIIQGGQSTAFGGCAALTELNNHFTNLDGKLNSGGAVASAFPVWKRTISDAPGPASVRGIQATMRAEATRLRTNAADAEDILRTFKTYASPVVTTAAPTTAAPAPPANTPPTTPRPAPATGTTPNPAPAGSGHPSPLPALEPPNPIVNTPQGSQASGTHPVTPTTPAGCEDATAVRASLAAASLSNPAYRERIDKIKQLATSLDQLADSLEKFTVSADWVGSNYVFYRSRPSASERKTITIKATPLNFRFDGLALTREILEAKAASTTFVLRQHQSVVPELGAGFVLASIRAPKYGTGTDAGGKTIVVRKDDKPVSYAGALLLNWVWAKPAQSSIHPLFQTGVSISPDGPGVLAGLGFRIGRPKRVALAAGGILMWVKDLDTLAVGGPVTGTAELDDDLEYKHHVRLYFTIQYQFKD